MRGLPHSIKALAAIFILALAVNAAMVYMSQRGNRDLVRPDYYAAGLDEDARIARRAMAAAFNIAILPAGTTWSLVATPRGETPTALAGSRCRLDFRRPEDGRWDRSLDLAWGDNRDGEGPGGGRWSGRDAEVRPGRYDVTATWDRDGESFMETTFPWVVHD